MTTYTGQPQNVAIVPYGTTPTGGQPQNVAIVGSLVLGAAGANLVTDWYIDPATGADANDGLTSGTALATFEEFFARIGGQPIDGIQVTVHVLSDVTPATGSLAFKVRFANSGALWVIGTKVVTATDGLSAVTPWNVGTGTIGSYTTTGTATAGLVGQFARTTAGPNAGLTSPIVKSTATNAFRGSWTDDNGYPADPGTSDTIEVFSVTKILGTISIETEGASSNSLGILFKNVEIGVPGQNHSVTIRRGEVSFEEAVVHGLDAWKPCTLVTVAKCYVVEFRVYGQAQTWGSAFTNVGGASFDARGGGVIITYGPTLVQGGTVVAGHLLEGAGEIVISDPGAGGGPLVVADYPTANGSACLVYPGSQITCHDHMFIRDAASTGQTGYVVKSGGQIVYDAGYLPQTFGTAPATFAKVGGTSKASAALPYFETTNGAAIVIAQ